jgi:hypothetical protein
MTRLQYWIVNAVGLASLALLGTNVWLATSNQARQADLAVRQQYVQQSVQLESLYREIIRALAELSARNNDADVKTMLAKHGITYSVNAPAPAPAAAVRK